MKRLLILPALLMTSAALAHDGPNPELHWDFNPKFQKKLTLVAQRGPDLILESLDQLTPTQIADHPSLAATGKAALVAKGGARDWTDILPKQDLTLSAWASVDKPLRWGGLVGCMQDNGSDEAGWILGYDEQHFSVGLCSEDTGSMTYLTGKTAYEPGKVYHIAATYDGEKLSLYVNGQLDAETDKQSGPVRYPAEAFLAVGGYRDANEHFPHSGKLRDVRVYALAATAEGIADLFDHAKQLAEAPADTVVKTPLAFEVKPFLQMADKTGITVAWSTTAKSAGELAWGTTAECTERIASDGRTEIHQIRISGLNAGTQYFYKALSADGKGGTVESETRTFETAPNAGEPIAFAVISDTQGNPPVAGKMAGFAWSQRPDFLLHPGDLTETGSNKENWTHEFFPSMEELISRVPIFPVLGNHEQNAHWYYDYMALPDPEYYYTFTYGPAQFFMLDGNKQAGPDSEQYQWLEKELAASTAQWKFACHHHPVYSSDENDYGNLWKKNTSSRGDMNVRRLAALYDKYNIDIVFNGHIHSYERTWPVSGNRATDPASGTVYMITGGGGGPLETAGPSRPFFQNTVRRGHHYGMVRINGGTLELQMYDIDGVLFDTLRIDKPQP